MLAILLVGEMVLKRVEYSDARLVGWKAVEMAVVSAEFLDG